MHDKALLQAHRLVMNMLGVALKVAALGPRLIWSGVIMAQRVVCRFCAWFTIFESKDDYEQAQLAYDAHLDEHIEAAGAELELSTEHVICSECNEANIVLHCIDAKCGWIVCPNCQQVRAQDGRQFTYGKETTS